MSEQLQDLFIEAWKEAIDKVASDTTTALLTKLREEVMGLREWNGNDAENRTDSDGSEWYYDSSEVLALIADLEKGGE